MGLKIIKSQNKTFLRLKVPMKRKNNGKLVKSSSVGPEPFYAYIPNDLPPNPPIDLSELQGLLEKASSSLGRLDGISSVLPDISIIIYMYVRKEAVLSSQIEGTVSSLSDLLAYENEGALGVPVDDVEEVSSYVSAMNFAMDKIQEIPLSLRLIRETHKILMSNSRGANKQPGEFRKSQNWIGGATPLEAVFVPPPVQNLKSCLSSFEKFLHNDEMPSLIKAAVSHVQFETIHPFLDGNGRMGRMLIVLMLYDDGLISNPYLYLSYYFKKHQSTYYDYLNKIRSDGDWEKWCEFFLNAVIETSDEAVKTIMLLLDLFEKDEQLIIKKHSQKIGLLNLYKCFKENPVLTPKSILKKTELARSTLFRNLKYLEEMRIIEEITGNERKKIFKYTSFVRLLTDGD